MFSLWERVLVLKSGVFILGERVFLLMELFFCLDPRHHVLVLVEHLFMRWRGAKVRWF